MTHIIITAGGTSESIDGVRKISNTSTGSLCACIYDALSEHIITLNRRIDGNNLEFIVHYVVAANAVRPEPKENLPVIFYPVTDVGSTRTTLESIMSRNKIGYVIHGMAVSDFKKDYLIQRETLAEELTVAVEKAFCGKTEKPDNFALKKVICDVLENPSQAVVSKSKVSSRDDLILSLVKTPKIIASIKKWAPDTFLVGFKLLNNVSENELINAAAELSRKNGCDLVLANDALRIKDGRHFGLLIKGNNIVDRFETKSQIAKGIAINLLGDRREVISS